MRKSQKQVAYVIVHYKDGSTEQHVTDAGFHRVETNYEKGAKSPDDAFVEHSIRWREDNPKE